MCLIGYFINDRFLMGILYYLTGVFSVAYLWIASYCDLAVRLGEHFDEY